MVHKYVWWDDIQKRERVRVELRIPKPLHEFLAAVAKTHGVSVNALVVGILAYASDSESHRRLRIEVVPAVRVTEAKPASQPVELTVPAASPADRKRWNRGKVL